MPSPFRLISILAGAWFAAALAPAQDSGLEKELAQLKRRAADRRPEERRAAWQELLAYGSDGAEILRAAVARQWSQDLRSFQRELRSLPRRHSRWIDAELETRRAEALAIIRDGQRYPDEAHGKVGQPAVDEKVGRLRELWEDPALALRAEHEELDQRFATLEDDLHWMRVVELPLPEGVADVDDLLEQIDVAFDMERRTPHFEWNQKVRLYHAEDCVTSVDAEERAVVLHTNRYRWMLGLPVLETDERLVRAARFHSREMAELGYFSHTSPVDAHRSPSDRARLQGYSRGAAENIAHASTGEAAFWSWYRSSGHHRNMLGGHQQIGVGRAGQPGTDLFTQCFGSRDTLRTRRDPPWPWYQYLVRRRALDDEDADDHYQLARWCLREDLTEESEVHARRALELQPDHPRAARLLAGEVDPGEEEGESESLRELKRALRSEDAAQRKRAVDQLAERREDVASLLRTALGDPASEVRAAAARALGRRAETGAARDLAALLDDKNPHTRHEAAAALYALGEGAGIERLLADLDGSQAERLSAGRFLYSLTGERHGYSWDLTLAERKLAIERWHAWWGAERERLLAEQRRELEDREGDRR